MKKFSDEDLIGYILGALEPHEEKQIEAALRQDFRLRDRLSSLEERLADLPDRFVEIDPPEGLADKTLNTIAIVDSTLSSDVPSSTNPQGSLEKTEQVELAKRGHTRFSNFGQKPEHELNGGGSHWSVADVIVGAVVCFVLAAVLLPSIANSRFQSNLLVCQDNLRQIGYNLASHSDSFDGRFTLPQNTDQWQASFFVQPILESGGQPQMLICPNDPGREETAKFVQQTWKEPITLSTPDDFISPVEPPVHPSKNELLSDQVVSTEPVVPMNCSAEPLCDVMRQSEAATGSYGFPAPQLTPQGAASICIPTSPTYVLCADAACFDNPGYRSRNHGGIGQNVLLGDLSVSYICNTACLPTGDHIYTNSQGQVQPGMYPGDNLIYRGVLKVNTLAERR